jgi:hypothetical protein
MYKTKAYSAASATSPLTSTTIPRRDPTDRDVQIEILFCGICHSDLHYARDEWHDVMPTVYPTSSWAGISTGSKDNSICGLSGNAMGLSVSRFSRFSLIENMIPATAFEP